MKRHVKLVYYALITGWRAQHKKNIMMLPENSNFCTIEFPFSYTMIITSVMQVSLIFWFEGQNLDYHNTLTNWSVAPNNRHHVLGPFCSFVLVSGKTPPQIHQILFLRPQNIYRPMFPRQHCPLWRGGVFQRIHSFVGLLSSFFLLHKFFWQLVFLFIAVMEDTQRQLGELFRGYLKFVTFCKRATNTYHTRWEMCLSGINLVKEVWFIW